MNKVKNSTKIFQVQRIRNKFNDVKNSTNVFQVQRIKKKFNDVAKIEIFKQCDIEKTIIENIIKKTTN